MKSLDEYKTELKTVTKDFIILKECEKKKRRHFQFQHLLCSEIFETDFASLKASIIKHDGGCPKCAKEKRIKNLNHQTTKEEFEKYIIDIGETEYSVNSVWFNKDSKRSYANITHKTCNRSFDQRINDFKSGYRCPLCALEKKDSFLTIKIKDYLEKRKINYETEIKLEISNRYLRNDFKINNLFIESDGEQHFMQKVHRDLIDIIRERDVLKDDYYFKNKDNVFLRIPYTEEKNVEKILDLVFKKEYNELKKYRCMIISEKTIINYENGDYYKINKTRSKRKSCRSKTVLTAGRSETGSE